MASGDTLLAYKAAGAIPPAATAATFAAIAGAATPAENFIVLAFDGSADEHADFLCLMPRAYSAATGITVTVEWSANGTSQAMVWDAALRRLDAAEDRDTTAHSYQYNSAGGVTSSATQGIATYTDITFTDGADMDSVAAGEAFVLRVRRDANNGSDTSTADGYLWGFEIKDT